ncbi:hypothetical protein [Thermodesulfovibrio yellowstonii]|uniref:Uncharacterized protein n=1 Tax=Thermodesulfovibrio yellowstonii TaxID=28262 RepID=A0A9W6GDN7_9BACT|nr:hypothetical protein [Thermodesulfovibrio islandicus]GLI53348.1 hypothetical protein TISLANDTSLP1_10410 [Thermodesulfovibrio islandicus]
MIKERLEWLNVFIENSTFKKAEISHIVGISPVSLRDVLLYGRKAINKEKFKEICDILHLNHNFFYSNDVELPFQSHSLYKLRIKEMINLIDIFSFKKAISGLSLIHANEVYFLMFRFIEHENILFLVAKKRLIGAKNQVFGSVTKTYEYMKSLAEKIDLKFLVGVTIEPVDFLINKKDFVNKFFNKCDYNDCMAYFSKDIVTTLKPYELEFLYFLRNLGITTKEQFMQQFKITD